MQQTDRDRLVSPGDSVELAGDSVELAKQWTAPFVILGETAGGTSFRPSDWAERLAGVMAAFRPGKAGSQQHLRYSPFVVPSTHRGIRCVIVDPKLRNVEPMAYSFVLSFANDNGLVTEALAASRSAGSGSASQQR